MGKPEYRKLIEDFCAAANIADVDGLLHRGQLLVDGMSVQLRYIEATAQCRIAVDFGAIPEAVERECHRLMLEWDFRHGEEGMEIFSVHPESGRAILILYLSLDPPGAGASLIELLDERLDPVRQSWDALLAELGLTPGMPPEPGIAKFTLVNFA
jgi:hypothetical protein